MCQCWAQAFSPRCLSITDTFISSIFICLNVYLPLFVCVLDTDDTENKAGGKDLERMSALPPRAL